MTKNFRLDDLYKMTVYIYGDQNAHRPTSATFSHFVEVCGLLTVHARKKKREEVTFVDALCKALGWYFPLMAKFNISSIEEMIFRKFPYSCPYCRLTPHRDTNCKNVTGTARSVDHDALRKKYRDNALLRPKGINAWQEMFNEIYPRDIEAASRSIVGLFEEIGELAEAVRVFERYPKYLAGEAADVFSYLMGLANEYNIQTQSEGHEAFDLESEYLKRFPGLCVQCGYSVCVCPLVPQSTVGRMAKELDLHESDTLFRTSIAGFRDEAITIARAVLDEVGGYEGIARRFPFDRGEANQALVRYCLEAAQTASDPNVAERLRSAALIAASSLTYAGGPRNPESLENMVKSVDSLVHETRPASGANDITMPGGITLPSTVGTMIFNMGSETTYNFKWNQIQNTINFPQLSHELSQVKSELLLQNASEDQTKGLAVIVDAQNAISQHDGSKLMTAFSKGGSLLLDVAMKVGADALAKIITHSMG